MLSKTMTITVCLCVRISWLFTEGDYSAATKPILHLACPSQGVPEEHQKGV